MELAAGCDLIDVGVDLETLTAADLLDADLEPLLFLGSEHPILGVLSL